MQSCTFCFRNFWKIPKNIFLTVFSFRKAPGYVVKNCNLLKIELYHSCLSLSFSKMLEKLVQNKRLRTEVYFEPSRTSTMERFCENSYRLKYDN